VTANGVDAGRRGTRRDVGDARTPLVGVRHEVEFQAFLERFGKRYCSGEDAKAACETSLRRQTVYYANMMRANAHNLDPTKKFQKTETKFADLTEREFEATTLTYRSKKSASAFLGVGEADENASEDEVNMAVAKVGVDAAAFKSKQEMMPSDSTGLLGGGAEYPAEFSWRTPPKGYGNVVGKVHDQDDVCASCWAFVTVDSIASRIAVINKGEDSPELSVKQLMACDGIDHGCATGNMYTAYEWIGTNRGISTRSDYDAASPGRREDDPDAQCIASVPKSTTPQRCATWLKSAAKNRSTAPSTNAARLPWASTPTSSRLTAAASSCSMIVILSDEASRRSITPPWLSDGERRKTALSIGNSKTRTVPSGENKASLRLSAVASVITVSAPAVCSSSRCTQS